ncbi:hypothetical protein X975_22137, partial [Stegodyphus mimosarum]
TVINKTVLITKILLLLTCTLSHTFTVLFFAPHQIRE